MSSRRATNQRRMPWPVACQRAFLCTAIAAALAFAAAAPAAAVDASASAAPASGADASAAGGYADFDRTLLSGAGQNTTDLSRFERGNPVMPGSYNTDIFLNNTWIGRTDVRFAASDANASATPCVDRKLLDQLGLHPAKLSAETLARLSDPTACIAIGSLIPGATITFDMSELRLDTTVPQAYLGQTARGYISPEYWDAGVPAALLNYNFNSYHSTSEGQSQTTSYLGLNVGLNVGPWHFRENGTLTWESATARRRRDASGRASRPTAARPALLARATDDRRQLYRRCRLRQLRYSRRPAGHRRSHAAPVAAGICAPGTRRGPDQRPGRRASERRADLPGYRRTRPVHDQRPLSDRLRWQPRSDGDRGGWPLEHLHRAVCLGRAIVAPGHHPLRHRRR